MTCDKDDGIILQMIDDESDVFKNQVDEQLISCLPRGEASWKYQSQA